MKQLFLCLFTGICLLAGQAANAQTMSNTDNVITLTNTCINAGISNGSYTLELNYYSLADFSSHTVSYPVTVTVSGGVMTITATSGTFPSVNNTGYWSLPDAWPGHIKLTGSTSGYMTFDMSPVTGLIMFNCIPLPVDFNSFTATQSGSTVVLHWQTGLEQNSTYIEIYRWSGNSGGYYKIGQVAAAGNSSLPVNYTYTDASPCKTNTYYLKILNNQGTEPIASGYANAGCSTCTCSLPSPVYCNYTINGPDHLCGEESFGMYSLSSPVPNYNTIAWSVDQSYLASLRTYPFWDASKASLLKSNYDGGVTLIATLSGCTNTITKYIALGTPDPAFNSDVTCPYVTLNAVNTPGAYSIDWWVDDASQGTTQPYTGWGANFQYDIGDGDVYAFELQYTNGCGTSNRVEVSGFWCDLCGTPPCVDPEAVSPNPTTGVVTIDLAPAAATSSARALTNASAPAGSKIAPAMRKGTLSVPAAHPKVYQVRVIDAQGVIQKRLSFPGGLETTQVDLSGLKNGIYIIQVFDNKRWKSYKVVLAK
jgi:hypothetical protein